MRKIFSLILFCFGIVGSAYADTPKILKLSELRPDTKAIGFSVFKGVEPEPFDVLIGETIDQLGNSLILARISGGPMETPLERIGAISGMSGSPIFVGCAENQNTPEEKLEDCSKNGTLVGALSYRIGSFIEGGNNVLLTPAEYMLGARLSGYLAAGRFTYRMSDKINVGGREFVNLMLFPKMDSLAASGESTGQCRDSANTKLKPGSMVSVFLATGTIPIAGSGTVTWVDGEKIYIFGHPLLDLGIIDYPFRHVSVAGTLQTPSGSYKMPGCLLETKGAMIVDGAFEVAGVIGRVAPMIPLRVEVHINNNLAVFSEEVARSSMASMVITGFPEMWAERLFGNLSSVPLAYQSRIVFKDEPEIFLKNIIPVGVVKDDRGTAQKPFKELFNRINDVFENLQISGFKHELESIQVHIDFVENIKIWRKKSAFLSQGEASPGETVYANLVLEEVPTRLVKHISVPVKVPDDFMERVGPGDLSRVTLVVQSGLRFTDRKPDSSAASIGDVIKKLNHDMNLPANMLYVQQVMPRTKADREADKTNSKSLTKPPLDWSDMKPGEIRQLPSSENLEFSLITTPPLDNFIDFEGVFNIKVEAKKEITLISLEKVNKNKKWFFLFLK